MRDVDAGWCRESVVVIRPRPLAGSARGVFVGPLDRPPLEPRRLWLVRAVPLLQFRGRFLWLAYLRALRHVRGQDGRRVLQVELVSPRRRETTDRSRDQGDQAENALQGGCRSHEGRLLAVTARSSTAGKNLVVEAPDELRPRTQHDDQRPGEMDPQSADRNRGQADADDRHRNDQFRPGSWRHRRWARPTTLSRAWPSK